jgi:hypothetical protein
MISHTAALSSITRRKRRGFLVRIAQPDITLTIPLEDFHPLVARVCRKLTERLYLLQTSFQPPIENGDTSSPLWIHRLANS